MIATSKQSVSISCPLCQSGEARLYPEGKSIINGLRHNNYDLYCVVCELHARISIPGVSVQALIADGSIVIANENEVAR